jgi:hypothetical protein
MDTMFTAVMSQLRTKNGDVLLDIARDLGVNDRLQINVVRRLSPFRRGRPLGTVPWHDEMNEILAAKPRASRHALLAAVKAWAGPAHDIQAVVETDRTECWAECPDRGDYHLHVLDIHRQRRPIAWPTVEHYARKHRQPPA